MSCDFFGYGHTKAEQTGQVLWSRGIAPLILNLGTGLDDWPTSRRGHFTDGKQRQYPPHRRLSRPYILSGRFEAENNLPGFEALTVQLVAWPL
jgi:hypothetical protein